MNKENKAKILMAFTMLVFGTISIFVRAIDVSTQELALYRALLASILLGSILLISKQSFSFKSLKKELLLLIVSGAMMGVNWILLFEAYRYTSISIATLSYYFAPILMILISWVWFKEKLTKKQIICFVIATVGLVLMNGGTSSGSQDVLGILFGLGAALLYAIVVMVNKYIKRIDGIKRTFIQFVSAMIILFPYVCFTSGFHLNQLTANGWIALLIVGFIHTGINYCLYFYALKDLKGQQVALLSYIDPLVALFVSFLWFHEVMTPLQMIGGILILGFTFISELSK